MTVRRVVIAPNRLVPLDCLLNEFTGDDGTGKHAVHVSIEPFDRPGVAEIGLAICGRHQLSPIDAMSISVIGSDGISAST